MFPPHATLLLWALVMGAECAFLAVMDGETLVIYHFDPEIVMFFEMIHPDSHGDIFEFDKFQLFLSVEMAQ